MLPGYIMARGATKLGSLLSGGRMSSLGQLEEQGKIPQGPFLTSQERQGLGIQPQSGYESFGQEFARRLPFSAIGGLPGVASSLAGQSAGTGLKSLGAPESVQTIGDIATSLGVSGLLQKAVPRTLQGAKELAYKTGEKAAEKSAAPASILYEAAKKASDKLSTETSKTISEQVSHALGVVEKNIAQGKIGVIDAFDIASNLNADISRYGGKFAKYMVPVKNALKDIIKGSGIEGSATWSRLAEGDKIHIFQNTKGLIGKAVQTLKPAATILGAAKVPFYGVAKFLEKPEYAIRALSNDAVRKHYFKLANAAVANDSVLIQQAAKGLGHILKQENIVSKEEPEYYQEIM